MNDMSGDTIVAAPEAGAAAAGSAWRALRVGTYAFALFVTLATIAFNVLLLQWLDAQPLVIMAVIPIIVSAYLGGVGPGLVSTLASVAGTIYFMLTPLYTWQVHGPADNLRWITLLLAGTLVSVLCEALHRSRRRAEAIGEEQRLAEERFRILVESAPQGVMMVDRHGSITLVNREIERAFGYSRDEMTGRALELLLPLHLSERHAALRADYFKQPEARAMGAGRDLSGLRKDGVEIPIEVGLVPIRIHDEPFVLATVVDISRRRQAEDAARRTEHLLQTVSENLNAIIWVKDLDGRYQFINGGFEKHFGRRREETLGETDFDLFPREQAEIFNRMDKLALAAGKSYQSEEVLLRDGEPFSVFLSVKCPLLNEAGQPYGLCGMSTDISERKLDEEALAAERTLLRTLIDSLPDIVFTKDCSGKFTLCNAAELRHTGLLHEVQLVGKTVFDLYPEELAQSYHGDDLQVINGTPVLNREEPSIDASGNRLWFLTMKVPLRNRKDEIVGLLGISRDITERKRAEEAQQRSQKMEALGTLAGGIAHDFNNILLAITGNAKLAMEDLPAEHVAQGSLNEIDKASLRASDLVRRILAFARQQEIRHTSLQLVPVVEEAIRLLRSTLPAMIRIETRFAADLPPVAADASQIHQILLNLATNAAYAIGEGQGLITIGLEAVIVNDDPAVLAPALSPGRYIRLSMIDDGCGMDKATAERIFDPFFTTKPVGQGTGLGLSTVHGIMQNHNGAVTVSSQPGIGTAFHLYFPSLTEVQAEPARPAPPLASASGERVLYVDDEQALVDLSTRILGRLGYAVTGHTEPHRALQAFREHPGDFDAAVTDLSMPGMSGFDLARALLAIRPDLPIVMTSGFVRQEDQETATRLGIRELILKPNTANELGRVLNELLRRNGLRPRAEDDR